MVILRRESCKYIDIPFFQTPFNVPLTLCWQLNKGKGIENSHAQGFGADAGLSHVQSYLILKKERQGREGGPYFSTKKKS